MAAVFTLELAIDPAFVLEKKDAPAFFGEVTAAFLRFETGVIDHFVGEKIQSESLHEHGPEGFDQIQSQGPTPVFRRVQSAERGIESVGMNGRNHLRVKNAGAEGDAGIDRVMRRARGPAFKRKPLGEEGGPGLEIAGSGSAFASAQFVEVLRPDRQIAQGLEELHVLGDLQGTRRSEALEDTTLVGDFGQDQSPGDMEHELGIQRAPVLVEPEKAVGIRRGKESAKEPPPPGQETDGDVVPEQCSHGFGGNLGAFPENQPFEVMERDVPDPGGGASVFRRRPDFDPLRLQADAGFWDENTGRGHGRRTREAAEGALISAAEINPDP